MRTKHGRARESVEGGGREQARTDADNRHRRALAADAVGREKQVRAGV